MGLEASRMILPLKIADWPLHWKELFEERAGIIEFSGRGVTRESAEFWAEKDIRRQASRESEVA
jgi:hypothetical protein